ncbi:MAG: glycosyltransferase [Candidatus Sumerlaeota bacterium]|nr:glycosyltransferase [Candidatus Sumerlaeota bacterium]
MSFDPLPPSVSVIVPVKNAAGYLGKLLDGLEALDYPRERLEVLFADGRSGDATRELAARRGWTVMDNPRQTVAPARNLAFERASGQFIAFTDADCVPAPDWLRAAVRWLQREEPILLSAAQAPRCARPAGLNETDGKIAIDPARVACVGGPNLTPRDETPFGRAVGFVFGQAIFAAGSVHARVLPQPRLALSIPGCNAIYRREALAAVMPVDESLLTCDDTELNRRLRDRGWLLLYTPDVIVDHYRRPTPRGLLRQMYRYAIGRAQFGRRAAGNINLMHHLAGLAAPVFFIVWILSAVVFGWTGWTSWTLAGAAWPLAVFVGHLAAGLWALLATRDAGAALRVPLVIFLICIGWSVGYLRERLAPMKDVAGK